MPNVLPTARRGSFPARCRTVLAACGSAAVAVAGVAVMPASLSMTASASATVPQPNPVPERWQLDFRQGPLRAIVVEVPDVGPRVYLYMTYTVINRTNEEQMFAPSFVLATDEGDVLRSGEKVPPLVTKRVKEQTQNPLVRDQIEILGRLGRGIENARDGVVIWPVPDTDADEFTVFAHGFSGETETYTRPDTGEDIVLRKAYQMRFALPGTLEGRGATPLPKTGEPDRWVLR